MSGGLVYIASSTGGKVIVTDREGNEKLVLGLGKGLGRDKFGFPRSVAVDRFGRIYVAAGGAERVLVYDAAGNFRYNFPQRLGPKRASAKPPEIGKPAALAYISDKLYVSDVDDQAVKVFSLTGKRLLQIGKPGTKKGTFSFPNAVAVSDEGLIYVADSNNSRVQVFDEKGVYVAELKGSPKTKFSIPRGLAIDKLGRVHVVDMMKNQIFVFSKENRYLFSYGEKSTEGGSAYPNGIHIDRDTGLIFLADQANNRVTVWAER